MDRIPTYEILEQRGLDVILVNGVMPGTCLGERLSDVSLRSDQLERRGPVVASPLKRLALIIGDDDGREFFQPKLAV